MPEFEEDYLRNIFVLIDDNKDGTVDILEIGLKLGLCGLEDNVVRCNSACTQKLLMSICTGGCTYKVSPKGDQKTYR